MTKKAFLTLACLLFAAIGARAEDTPTAGRLDPRMRYLAYNPDQVVRLSTAVGATLVVTFGANETVTAVAVSNSKDLAALPRGNYLFFKASKVLPPQPVVVLTASDAGMRRYVFSISSKTLPHLDKEQADLYYSVQFAYPADDAAARQKGHKRRLLQTVYVRKRNINREQRVYWSSLPRPLVPRTRIGTMSLRAIVRCCRSKSSMMDLRRYFTSQVMYAYPPSTR